jgi:hypothetical protein
VLTELLSLAPGWCTEIDVNTLITMNGRKIKGRMRSQWEYKPRSFEVDTGANLLILTVGDLKDRNDFRKDLRSHVYYDTREDKLIVARQDRRVFQNSLFQARF